jgi:KUP system potassium uptake protein
MEPPDIPDILQRIQARGSAGDFSDAIYFLGREAVVRREDGKRLSHLVESTFAFLLRNSIEAVEYFSLPRDNVVELGREFAI